VKGFEDDDSYIPGFWFKNESQLVWKNITGWKSLAAGYSHTCGITDEDTIL